MGPTAAPTPTAPIQTTRRTCGKKTRRSANASPPANATERDLSRGAGSGGPGESIRRAASRLGASRQADWERKTLRRSAAPVPREAGKRRGGGGQTRQREGGRGT